VSADITVPFSEAMDSSTINSTNITVIDGSGNPVNGVWSYSGTTATFNPSSDLSYSTTYTVTVGTGVKDSAGNNLASASSWNFTTTASWVGTQQIGTSSTDCGFGITTDSSGNIYVTGYTVGDLDGNSNAGELDLFVVKYSSTGVKQWTRQLGTSAKDSGRSISTDSNDNVYVTGYTVGDLDGNSSAGSNDFFIAKYSSSGDKQWTRQLGTSSSDYGFGIATDSNDNVYVTGYTEGDLDGNSSAGNKDIFIVKYSSSGDKQWTRQLGTSSNEVGYDITINSSDNVYVTGYTEGDLDGNSSAGGGTADLFVVKYDSEGVKQWTRQLGTSSNEVGYNITSDSSSNVYVTGYTSGDLDGNTNAGSIDFFVVKYSGSGDKQWTRQLGTSSNDFASVIASDSSDNIYVTGYTGGDLDGNTNAGGAYDLFVIKFNSSGTKQWTRQLGTSSSDLGTGISDDSNNNIYVTGYTDGNLDGNTNAGGRDIFVMKFDSNGNKQ
jgi:hypothetical protein